MTIKVLHTKVKIAIGNTTKAALNGPSININPGRWKDRTATTTEETTEGITLEAVKLMTGIEGLLTIEIEG